MKRRVPNQTPKLWENLSDNEVSSPRKSGHLTYKQWTSHLRNSGVTGQYHKQGNPPGALKAGLCVVAMLRYQLRLHLPLLWVVF